MRILSLLLTIWLSVTALWAQKVHLVFQDAPLSYALGKIDEAFPDVHIHFIVDELVGLTVSADIDHTDAFTAIHAVLADHPFSMRQEGRNIFIVRQDAAEDDAERHRRDAIRSYRLDEVLVLEHLPVLHDQGNTAIVLDVKGSELAHRGSAIDLLAYLPGLKVSQQQVILHDNRTPVIYIDGVLVSSPTELYSLRSEEISRISMLETADPSYPSQSGMVIRIFTSAHKSGFDLMTQVDASSGHRKVHQENVKLLWQGSHLHLSGGVLFRDAHEYQENQLMDMFNTITPVVTSLNPYFQTLYRWNEHHSLSMKYEMLGILRPVAYWSRLLGIGGGYFDANNIGNLSVRATSEWNLDYCPRHNAKLRYAGEWGKAAIHADMEYYSDKLSIRQHESSDNQSVDSLLGTRVNGIGNDLWAGKVDVRLPFAYGSLTVGNELTNTRRLDDVWFEGRLRAQTLRQETQTTFYALAEWTLPKVTFHIGLRDEFLHTVLSRAGQRSNYDKNYLLPYADVSFPSGLSLSYSVRTQRPNYNQLNGYTRFNQFMMPVSGNPDLIPATRHVFNLQYRQKPFLATLRYQHIRNFIASTVRGSLDTHILDYTNLPHAEELSAGITYTPHFAQFCPVASAHLYLQDLSMPTVDDCRLSFRRPVLFLDVHCPYSYGDNLQFWADLHLQTSGHFGTVLHHHTATFRLGASLQLGHFDLRFHAEDIFHTGATKREYFGADSHIEHWHYDDTQRIGVSVGYSLVK